MSNYRVIFKRVVSADGRAIATARSEVSTSGDAASAIDQSVTVHVSSTGSSSSARSCASNCSDIFPFPHC